MSLLAELREKQKRYVANANLANLANLRAVSPSKLAKLAKIAVANPEKDSPGADANLSRWWRVCYCDRPPLEVLYPSGATRAVVLAAYPDARQAQPFTPSIRLPSSPLTGEEETLLRRWLAQTGETDPAIIAATLDQCQRDADARHYFIKRAASELPP